MQIEIDQLTDDQSKQYRLKNNRGIEVSISNRGGRIDRLLVPDRNGHQEDIIFSGFFRKSDAFDSSILTGVSGQVYDVSSGTVRHSHLALHDFVFNDGERFTTTRQAGLRLSTEIVVEDQSIDLNILYLLTNDNQLTIHYVATTKQPLRLSLSLPIFFNLSGNCKESITQHDLKFSSSHFLHPAPTLLIDPLFTQTKGTDFDFQLGRRLNQFFSNKTPSIHQFDTYFLFHQQPVISIHEAVSGRWMTIETSQPGFVLSAASNNDRISSYFGICFDSSPFVLSSFINQDSPYSQHITYSFSTTY
ncbi:hypothetical protein [Exiguobacterium sp. R-39]|uniref:aldose epimerase family protein n=1 Tax=Exiguobacterium sp. R-39 TaxID=3416708 RepID=UPI003CF097F4